VGRGRRGFTTFYGYYAACQVDYWYHGTGPQECGAWGIGGNVSMRPSLWLGLWQWPGGLTVWGVGARLSKAGKPLVVGNISDFSNSTETITPAFGSNGTAPPCWA
jgi:hypothetical protein